MHGTFQGFGQLDQDPTAFAQISGIWSNSKSERKLRKGHSKSGAMFSTPDKDGSYPFIFGDQELMLGHTKDFKHFTTGGYEKRITSPKYKWENQLLESGPSPIKTRDGKYILFYNGATLGGNGKKPGTYSAGQMLFDKEHLDKGPITRLEEPFLTATTDDETNGQVDNVVFVEGLVQFIGKWFLYYGQGDQDLAVATADVEPWEKDDKPSNSFTSRE